MFFFSRIKAWFKRWRLKYRARNIPDDLKRDIGSIFPVAGYPHADRKLMSLRIRDASLAVIRDSDMLAEKNIFAHMVITPPLCLYLFYDICIQNGINPYLEHHTEDECYLMYAIKRQVAYCACCEKKLREGIISLLDRHRHLLHQDGHQVEAAETALLQSILLCDQDSWSHLSLIEALVTRSINAGARICYDHDMIHRTFGDDMQFSLLDEREMENLSKSKA